MNLLVISKFLSLAASFSTIGLLLAMGFFLIDTEGKLAVTGNLTIKNTTKSITIPATIATVEGITTFKSETFS